MARIEIEDLPVADNLTPEQEELIQGAGPRSFRPTLEALEGREMMDAGLGHGLQLPVALPASGGADPAGQVRLLTPTTDVSQAGMYRALAQLEALDGREMRDAGLGHGLQLPVARPAFGGAAPAGHVPVLGTSAPGATQAPRAALPRAQLDQMFAALGRQGLQGTAAAPQSADRVLESVAGQAKDKFNEVMGANRFDNKWWLQRVESTEQSRSGDRIRVKLNFTYGLFTDAGRGYVEMDFKRHGSFGGQQTYKFDGIFWHSWERTYSDDWSALKNRIDQVYNGWSARGEALYDEGRVVQGLAQRVESICHAKGFYPNDKLSLDRYEAKEGGLRVWVKLPDTMWKRAEWLPHRLALDFDYQGRKGQVDVFKLQDVSRWEWDRERNWHTLDLDKNVADSLKSAEYKFNHGDRSRELADGKRFGDQALTTILEKANAYSGRPTDGYRISNVTGSVERVELTDEGVRVVFRLQTRMQYQHDPSIQSDNTATVGVTLKFEGETNGVTRYTCTGTDHEFEGNWHGHSRRNDYTYENVFGLSDAGLKQDFQNWSSSAAPQGAEAPAPQAALPQAHLSLDHQGQPQGVNAPQGLAGRTIDQIVAAQLWVGTPSNLGGHWRIDSIDAISATPDGRDFKVEVKVNLSWAQRKWESQTLSIRLTPSSEPGHYTVKSLEQGQQGYQFSTETLGRMQRAVTDVQFQP